LIVANLGAEIPVVIISDADHGAIKLIILCAGVREVGITYTPWPGIDYFKRITDPSGALEPVVVINRVGLSVIILV
jgi:hypothetical protein